ncbi:hypothetical protein DUNSADRAFT_8073 [Dunaliella salina]|uniref:SET domain-containing protein n=1 Tax=Dunaliella salina TaxID=3046 RepID=A0ABQ7GK26_DUNSA|nr:hypothetical protein DUNSADRAFT_8073 [Dunaliella salina]|eukprot:KAF5834973.1 hypothetical protein DUNSADRAFT_8073 [Dunaliella salina]
MLHRGAAAGPRPFNSCLVEAHLQARNKHPAHLKRQRCRTIHRSACGAGDITTCGSNTVDALNAQLLYEEHPPRAPNFIGPIKVIEMPGKGRGIVASADLKPGTLLLAVPPVAYLCEVDAPRPSGETLVDEIIDKGLWKHSWMQSLYDGSYQGTSMPSLDMPSVASGSNASTREVLDEENSPSSQRAGTSSGATNSGGPSTTNPEAACMQSGFSPEDKTRIAKMTKFNCFGDNREDDALCAVSGRPSAGHIGIWGPFAMLNHSCAPNTMNYVVDTANQGIMVVRAAKAIAQGEEVTISYMGRPQLRPVGPRQVKLLSDYGFECDCQRCLQEQALEEKLGDLYEGLWDEVSERRRPEFDEACLTYAETGDEEDLQALHEHLQASMTQLLGKLQKARVAPNARLAILGSMFELFELKMDVELALDYTEEFVYTLGTATKAVQAVSPGSDLAVSLASVLIVTQARLHGAESPQVAQGKALSDEALLARYGPIKDDALKSQLRKANLTMYN